MILDDDHHNEAPHRGHRPRHPGFFEAAADNQEAAEAHQRYRPSAGPGESQLT